MILASTATKLPVSRQYGVSGVVQALGRLRRGEIAPGLGVIDSNKARGSVQGVWEIVSL